MADQLVQQTALDDVSARLNRVKDHANVAVDCSARERDLRVRRVGVYWRAASTFF
jgi:hypothetical protein